MLEGLRWSLEWPVAWLLWHFISTPLLPTCFTPATAPLAAPLAADLLFPCLISMHTCTFLDRIEAEIHPPGFSFLLAGRQWPLLRKKCHSIEDGRVTVSKPAIMCLYLTSRSTRHLYLCQMKYFSHQSTCHNAHLELFHTKQSCRF